MDRGCRMMMMLMLIDDRDKDDGNEDNGDEDDDDGDVVWFDLFIYCSFNCMHDRESERLLHHDLYDKVRHASEVHRQVRHYAQSFIRPGIKLTDMCERLEECNRRLVKENGLQVTSMMDTIAQPSS